MNLTLSLLFVIFSALYIYVNSADVIKKPVRKTEDLEPTDNMLRIEARKTKEGWRCADVICPQPRTASCKTTSILKPNEKLEHDLLVACMDANNKIFCGITRSSRVAEREVVEVNDEGEMEYRYKETIVATEGRSIPRCLRKVEH